MDDGEAVTYALGKLDDRGRMFVQGGRPAVRRHDRSASTSATTTWSSTPCAASSSPTSASRGKEDAIKITPPIELTLEYAVEFIADDELVEITPKSIRLRKRHLKEHERKKASREAA